METEQRSLCIPLNSGTDVVEIFPDEMPNDVQSLLDVLRAEYAPLKVWRASAVEYYYQKQFENFEEVLNEIVTSLEDRDIEQFYRERGGYEEAVVEIFDSLAAFSLYRSYTLVDYDQNKSKLEELKTDIVANIRKTEGINPRNEYTWLLLGFYELSYGDIESADYYFTNVYNRSMKQKTERKTLLYPSTIGMGAVAYAKRRYSAAIDYFVRAVHSNPLKCDNNVRVAIATCCFKLEQYDRAKLAVDRVLSIDPANIDALVILSLLQRIEGGKVDLKKRHEYHRVARDLCNLIIQINPHNAIALNQVANYKFEAWRKANISVVVVSPDVIDFKHLDNEKAVSIVEDLQLEDVFKFQRGLVAHIVQNIASFTDDKGVKVTRITLKRESEIPIDWVGKEAVISSLKSKASLNEACQLAANGLRGSDVKEIRAESFYILGRVYHLLSQHDNAMKFYSDALLLKPDLSLASYGIGLLLMAKEDYSLAYEKFNDVLKKYPDDKDTQAYMLLIQSYHKNTPSTLEKLKEVAPGFVFEADLWLAQGYSMHEKGPAEYAKALKCYEMAYSVMKEQQLIPHSHVLLNMGVLYHAAGNLDKALHFTQLSLIASDRPFIENESGEQVAVEPNPLFSQPRNDVFYTWSPDALHVQAIPRPESSVTNGRGVYSWLAPVNGKLSDYAQGDSIKVNEVVLIVENVEGNIMTCRGLVSLVSTADDDAASWPLFKKTPRHNFNNETIAHCFNLARIHEDAGQTQAAIEVYEQLLKLHPSHLECYLRLSMIYSDIGRKEDALSWIERGIALDKSNNDTAIVSGDLYCQLEDWDKAKTMFEKVCKDRKDDGRSCLSLGNLYFANASSRESEIKMSMKFYHVVLRNDPRNVYAANGLGMICSMEGKSDVARDIFSRAREANILPPSNDIVVNLGHVHLQQGRHIEAIRTYKSVLKSLQNSSYSTHGSQISNPFTKTVDGNSFRHPPIANQVAVNDCLALAYLRHKQHEDAVKAQLKSLHLDPTQTHVWYNLAYTKEECAVATLLKPHKTVPDIKYAIGEIESARNLFVPLADERLLSGISKHKRFNTSKAQEHADFCNVNLDKFRHHLDRLLQEEERKNLERSVFLAEQQNRVEEKERARREVQEEQARINAARLEKAKQKQQLLEQTWQSAVGSQAENDSGNKKGKRKRAKGGNKKDSDEEASGDVDKLLDDIDGGSDNDKEAQEMFDSDEDDNDVRQQPTNTTNDVTEENLKEVFGSDSSDNEEEFDIADDASKKTTGRLKRPLASSDDDEAEMDLTLGEKEEGNGIKSEGGDSPVRQRRKVIADDDDEGD